MDLELKDYISVLKKRKKYFIIVASTILILSILFALRISNYRSTATVEIAPSEVTSTAIPTNMTASDYRESLADLRISHLQQKVLSTASLIEIITKLDLYPQARKATPIAEIAERMRRKIKLDLVSSSFANPSAQRSSADAMAAIAFNLSFDYSNPLITQQVTNELVSRFLDEDLKDRRSAARETTEFLDGQIKAMEESLAEQEKKIAEFRAGNEGADPEFLAFNQQASQSMQVNIQNIDSQMTANLSTQGTLRGQLATLDPYSRVVADGQLLTTPSIQLKALKAQFATLSAQYGPDHPDVVKARNQIKALQGQVGGRGGKTKSGNVKAQIEDTETNLAAAKKTYGDDHPDVIALKRKLDKLETQLDSAQSSGGGSVSDADNPAYLQTLSQLKSTEAQYKALLEQKDSLLEEQKKYHKAISANPTVVQKMAELTRDYENSQLRYRALKEKKMAADMNETIELGRSGQRLILLNPPELPTQTQPARKLFVVAGLILGIIGGLGSVAAAQMASQSVIGPRHLEALVGVPPLVTIPYLATAAERGRIDTKRLKLAGLIVGGIIIAAILFSSLVMPLDVLWVTLLQKAGF